MTITAITIENFKGIREPVRVELKPITLLFGPNSAGKSTIVQALHYAREIFARSNLNPDTTIAGGKSVNLGGFKTLVYDNDLSREVMLRLDLDLAEVDIADFFIGDKFDENGPITHWENSVFKCLSKVNSAWVGCSIKWDTELNAPDMIAYRVGINGFLLAEMASNDFDNIDATIYANNVLKDTKFMDTDYQHRMRSLKDYEEEEYLQPPHDYSTICKHEMDLLESYEEDIEPYTKNDECGDIFELGKEIGSFILEQDTVLPKWDEGLKFFQPFWKDEHEERLFFEGLLNTLILGPSSIIRKDLAKMAYLGPIRDIPPRNHIPSLSPDESLWASGVSAWDILYKSNESFIDDVNGWLSYDEEGLDSGYSVEVKEYRELETESPIMLAVLQGRLFDEDIDLSDSITELPVKRRLLIRDLYSNTDLSPQDIGVGISQVLPVVVAALHHKTGIVAIEQPELHIHPAFQVALGDLFIEKIRRCLDLTFILETHSEHLMLRFLRRIRETTDQEAPDNRKLVPKDLSIHFMEKGEDGISCTNIRVDEEGDFIDHWPKGFFNERVKELY